MWDNCIWDYVQLDVRRNHKNMERKGLIPNADLITFVQTAKSIYQFNYVCVCV